uniref:Copper transport protein n=1 Tax=Grammatophora oceanica TaxID=210454 RepID=A0A7S1UT88_9STRA|mmetsp:Transcript_21845/g.32508  ORF Transcript_21845/g.32508 Transcript_21845/m.32508 type:complete len:235 (+) Transcript_21845:148-852(+)
MNTTMHTGMEMNHTNVTHMVMSDESPFCSSGGSMHGLGMSSGGGMIMYMDGFRIALKGNQPCLNLFFPSWTLDTKGKFIGALIGILFLAIATEAVSHVRFLATNRLKGRGAIKRWTLTVLHGFQALLGYTLMLATMTFSVEMLLCVVLGLGIGYSLFYRDQDAHVTSNPCCEFIQSEADEKSGSMMLRNSMVAHEANQATAQRLIDGTLERTTEVEAAEDYEMDRGTEDEGEDV